MFYYEVAVGEIRYRGDTALTYASDVRHEIGKLVTVPLRDRLVLGIITTEVEQPSFDTLPLEAPFSLVLPREQLELLKWMQTYYPGPLSSHAQLFLPRSLTPRTATTPKVTHSQPPEQKLPMLTSAQNDVIESIHEPGTYLLHGETGSGKTRVYLELAARANRAGKSSVILTPEIGLTPQLAKTFQDYFGETQVAILHSQLTDAHRRKLWLHILTNTEPMIVIGPRSALFSPLKNIGLIVMDESHDPSYKQDQLPRYHAGRVAATVSAIHKATLVLGSATPAIIDYYFAEQRGRPILRMEGQARSSAAKANSTTQIIDMRDNVERSRDQDLSKTLIAALTATLDAGNQALLLINRRGSARVVLCDRCGWQATCPHCDLPLTYHHDRHELRCHVCNFMQISPSSCINCGNTDIILKSVGTKTIADRVQKLFPAARVARFDADNVSGERLSDQYDEVHRGDIDILVGTQILAKGLDLPNLTLVGVINSDASLYIPDYTSSERAYQLLHQVIGRVGRGSSHGTVILQTYTPDNQILNTAASHDWQSFYRAELAERKQFLFPPFTHMLKLSCARATSDSAESAALKIADAIRAAGLRVQIDGPAPAFHTKVHNKYVWQLVLKASQRQELLRVIALLPRDWHYDLDPANLL